MPEAIARAFPLYRRCPSRPRTDPSAGILRLSKLRIGTTGVSVEDCISAIRGGDHWHNNLLRLIGHWIGRGWSDAEIHAAA